MYPNAFSGIPVRTFHMDHPTSAALLECSSDLFSLLGAVLLWVYWPSFNAVLASGDAFHRAVINTHLSLLGSTSATFVVATFFGE